MTTPIPRPPTIPFLGNATLIESDVPMRSFNLLAKQYGEIYELILPGRTLVNLCSYNVVKDTSNEKIWKKALNAALREVRHLTGDGLFTAENEEPNWALAHRILMPAFGPANIRNMFEDMTDICSQMLLKWDRFGKDHVFEAAEDYTRLALDTLALCAMSYRFNSFYTKDAPPFCLSMFDFLVECGKRANRPSIVQSLMRGTNAKFESDNNFMTDLARDIIKERREHAVEKRDLLTLMLEGEDPKTHEKLSEMTIIYNLLTFLIAGHETTSGMLSFTTYYLLKNPDSLRKLRQEIDEVCGDQPPALQDLARMPYLNAVMRESLRLSPTAAIRSVYPAEDTTLADGKYSVKKDTIVLVHTLPLQRDPEVWGEDADLFRPERMLDGKFEAMPPHAWQPFGAGMRACIGRPFSWQEAQLTLTSVFQKFDLFMADPSYTLELQQSLTIKPKKFFIRAVRREGRRASSMLSSVPRPMTTKTGGIPADGGATKSKSSDETMINKQKVHVLYGSNSGTSESFAQRLVTDASEHGFSATLGTLDSASFHLPTDGPVLIVTASFEGEPADNAAQFVNWLQNLHTDKPSLQNVQFALFGCGNREWFRTYQRIPRICDELLAANGAERLFERGEGDASLADFFQRFDEYEDKLWKILEEKYKTTGQSNAPEASLDVKILDTHSTRAELLRQHDMAVGEVIENRLLTKPGAPMKRHIGLKLPEGMTYRAGDYLAILPSNPPETVQRALALFALSPEQEVEIQSNSPTTLPLGKPISAQHLFSGYVELSQPATVRDLQFLASSCKDESTQKILHDLVETYATEVLAKRVSVLDLLEDYTNIKLSLPAFLRLLPPMRVRQYSISSSSLVNPEHVSLTVSVVDAPALSCRERVFLGVASNYLAHLKPKDKVQMVVRPSGAVFHPPADPSIPIMMFCAGSGLAPFRGFIQERLKQKESGRVVGETILFFGCRSPEEDYLYSDGDLKEWREMGVVDVRPAFSRKMGASEGCKYVQDRVWHDRDDISRMYEQGAKLFTCGSRKIANGVKEACVNIIKLRRPDLGDEGTLAAFEKVQKERYATDIFD